MTPAPTPGRLETRPYVWANCAVSADGRLAYAGGARARLSGPEDLRRVQRLRARSDAILVGIGTVLLDDPSLKVHWELLEGETIDPLTLRARGHPPARVVLDSRGRLPSHARLLDGSAPTFVIHAEGANPSLPPGTRHEGIGRDKVDIARALAWLRTQGVHRLMVEGGAGILAAFLKGGFVDRLTVYQAPCLIGGSTAPALMTGAECRNEGEAVSLRVVESGRLGDGVLTMWEPHSPRA